MRIFYCDKCETRLCEEDIESGRAICDANEEHTYCVACAPAGFQNANRTPAKVSARPSETSASLQRRTPARITQPNKPSSRANVVHQTHEGRISSGTAPAVAETPDEPAKKFPLHWAILAGAVPVLAIVAVLYTQGKSEPAPKVDPAPIVSAATVFSTSSALATPVAEVKDPTATAPTRPNEPAEPAPKNMFEEMAREHRREFDPEQQKIRAAKKLADAVAFHTANAEDPWTYAEMLDRIPAGTPSNDEAMKLKRELVFPEDKSLTPGWYRDWTIVSRETVTTMQNTFEGRKNVLQTSSTGASGEVLFSRKLKVPDAKPFFSIAVRCEDKGTCLFAIEVEGKQQLMEVLKGYAWRTYDLDLSSLKNQDVTMQLRLIAQTPSNPSMFWTPPIFRDVPDTDVKVIPFNPQAAAFVAPKPPPPRVYLASKTWKESSAWKTPIDILGLIDPKADAVVGEWKRNDKGELESNRLSGARVAINYKLPEQYDVRASFERKVGNADVALILSRSGKSFIWTMGAFNNTFMGIATVNDKKYDGNPAASKMREALKNGTHYTTLVEVRKDRVSAYLNDKLIQEWTPSMGNLGIDTNWKVPAGKTIGLGAWQTEVVFHTLQLVEVK